jgi:hypothetical protein
VHWAREVRHPLLRSQSRGAGRAAAFVALTAAGVLFSGDTRAESSDTTYGRVEGDLTLAMGLGGTVTARGVRAAGELRLRYMESAGVFASYEDAALFGAAADSRRLLCAGVEVRPLFLYRWLKAHETQWPRLDLLIDSVGLELGAVFAEPAGAAFASQSGLEVALGVEMPIFDRAAGPWVAFHGGLRWSDEELASGVVRDANDRSAFLLVTLAWHLVEATHLVDLGDEIPR